MWTKLSVKLTHNDKISYPLRTALLELVDNVQVFAFDTRLFDDKTSDRVGQFIAVGGGLLLFGGSSCMP
jgi:hypothetical protein